jgi:hypothetical protein
VRVYHAFRPKRREDFMTDFETTALVPDILIYRATLVSQERGQRELRLLTQQGKIRPVRTPTGRTLLSIHDAKRIFESLRERK